MPMLNRRRSVLSLVLATGVAGIALAAPGPFVGVATPNPKAPGITAPNALTPELVETMVAQGAMPLENPGPTGDLGGGTSIPVTHYGYYGDGPFLPPPCAPPACPTPIEARKSEPDKNTYLVFRDGLPGADPHYDYGHRFLFQGHENGSASMATGNPASYITRVNLDADVAHRVTLLATTDVDGHALPVFDGSTWDPWTEKLLFTAELGNKGGVWQASVDEVPARVEDISGALGRGGYEGIQNDSAGNLWIVEDTGGGTNAACPAARQPNSFVYRFVPNHPDDLTVGKLQVLQVMSARFPKSPITFHAGNICGDALSQDMADLHAYGFTFHTRWVTIHDTSTDGTTPFDANALAKTKGGTPFKRPENGLFRPGSGFTQFFFDETGDTNATTVAAAANDPMGIDHGGFGAIMRLSQTHPSANQGQLRMFYRGDRAHTGLDNCAFWSEDEIIFVEDAGDGLHTQRNALDSAYFFHIGTNYANPANVPVRILAQGRDASATLDSALGPLIPGFPNDGDNEITGTHISDGDPSLFGILGNKIPDPFKRGWRFFYTQQHGDNVTYEILKKRPVASLEP